MLSDKYRQWKSDCGWFVRIQLMNLPAEKRHIRGRYELQLNLPPGLRGDIDNYLKAVSDLLQDHGVIENDRLCMRCAAERMSRAGQPTVWITPWKDIIDEANS